MSNVHDFPKKPKSNWRAHALNAQELGRKKFKPLQYALPGLIAEGVTLLGGRPKIGKSWFLLQCEGAVAKGTTTLSLPRAPTPGDVLKLSLEDGERRIQRRMEKHFGEDISCWPSRLTIAAKWSPLDRGGLEDIREWCKEVERPALVTIDTLQKVRPEGKAGKTAYTIDYEANKGLLQICHEFPGLAIMTAVHDRKMGVDDVFDTLSGTLGLTGGVDSVALIKKDPIAGNLLHVQGRDLEETICKGMSFDRETCRWQIFGGDALKVRLPPNEKLIVDALAVAGAGGLDIEGIMQATGLSPATTVRSLLSRMVGKETIGKLGRGRYILPLDMEN
jgi:hypothetical protein